VLQRGDMVRTDTGAEFNHYLPTAARCTCRWCPRRTARLYTIALDVQKTVINMVRPGVTWWELHDKATEMLREAGGYDKDYYYGIGHFIGMEVHDEGDYLIPLQAGMVLSIEQGVMKPGEARIACEDDVLVTEDGYEWLSRGIPIEIDEVEAMLAKPGAFDNFIDARGAQ
jgi:Xaa-Pro aminopeptidase